jgi:regulator-associated protein of mTOR
MRTANDPGHALPNPLASHAPASMDNAVVAASAPRESRPSQDTAASPRLSISSAAAAAHLHVQSPTATARPALSTTNSGRPGLLRAKSDFGPRQPVQSHDTTPEDGSVDGHFKIRHGWDDQLNSEEYSNMLTSVRCA